MVAREIPLSIYVHIPWCVRKCPYCDFNSHAVKTGNGLDEEGYVRALLDDLDQDNVWALDRSIQSIFIGGGTPSLFSGGAIAQLLNGIEQRLDLASDVEITLEANPGTLEAAHFAGYLEAGVNRLSIGIQSLNEDKLKQLGRIHGPAEAISAVETAKSAGFDRINLDLMFGLPGQALNQALDDLSKGVELGTGHLSWYQLTLEPNTAFYQSPPDLPSDDEIWDMQQEGQRLLQEAGIIQYEISAYAKPGQACRHNLNYWHFGDYLGIGAGAHGKVSQADGSILRYSKERHPEKYLATIKNAGRIRSRKKLSADDLPIEYLMNVLRLNEGVSEDAYALATGRDIQDLKEGLRRARDKGLMDKERLQATPLGHRYLNDLLALFM